MNRLLLLSRKGNLLPLSGNLSKLRSVGTTPLPNFRFGEWDSHTLTHLTTPEVFRALLVLRLCSLDLLVDRANQLFEIASKLGGFGEWLMRRTFFDQFVGGDEPIRMTSVSNDMTRRGLSLMLVPVLEEDPEENKSSSKVYDANLESILRMMEFCSLWGPKYPIFQLKVSSIVPASTLEHVSNAIDSHIKRDSNGLRAVVQAVANIMDGKASDFNLEGVDPDEALHFCRGVSRVSSFAKAILQSDIRVLVDAEFFACRSAISAIATALMVLHNRKDSQFGNTIQAYLKDAPKVVKTELDLVMEGFGANWAGKLVRGAYMDRERLLATKRGYPSPICNSYETTNKNYFSILGDLVGKVGHLVVASHNEASIRLAANLMEERGISPGGEHISFAQIYGMADYLSIPLIREGHRCYKSTPYGPLGRVLPYLARRASENRTVIKGARQEMSMLQRELKHRVLRI